MTIANKITYSRFFLFSAGMVFLSHDWFTISLVVISASFILDGFDGYFARSLNQVSLFGGALDFMIDRITLSFLVIYLAAKDLPIASYPKWVAAVLVTQAVYQFVTWFLLLRYAKEASTVTTPRTQIGRLIFVLQILSTLAVIAVNIETIYGFLSSVIYMEILVYSIGFLTLYQIAKDVYITPFGEFGSTQTR